MTISDKGVPVNAEEKGIRQCMLRKGNCLDNAVIENIFDIKLHLKEMSPIFYRAHHISIN
jgi:transposase InsO family protein